MAAVSFLHNCSISGHVPSLFPLSSWYLLLSHHNFKASFCNLAIYTHFISSQFISSFWYQAIHTSNSFVCSLFRTLSPLFPLFNLPVRACPTCNCGSSG